MWIVCLADYSHKMSSLIFSENNFRKEDIVVLNAHLCWKVGQGHSISTTIHVLHICKFQEDPVKTDDLLSKPG